MNSFWHTLPKPLIGLCPMDGITDAPFRAVVDEIGHPSVLYTEFISADGFLRKPGILSRILISHTTRTPLIVQLFGADPDTMYESAVQIIKKFPVLGIDINMGCPNKRIMKKNGGASLINNPRLAQKLIRCVRKAIKDSKRTIGLSVKTRIGFDTPITESWVSSLLLEKPDAIALHGRTFKQMYTGTADWDEVRKAADLASQTQTLLLGNGDINSRYEAIEKSKLFSPDGVLIGRAAQGNPWVFTDIVPDKKMRIYAALKHLRWFEQLTPNADILSLRKHLAWYVKGFPNSSEIRKSLVSIRSIDEAQSILKPIVDNS